MTARHLRLIRSPRPYARAFAELAAQAAELSARLARRGEIEAARKALTVSRTMIEHAEEDAA